jgi:NAD(P)-dependent dehydrogenase (short-subunit alcohol dehydrogenase family)
MSQVWFITGSSRGIGRGLAREYLRGSWFVVGTVRSSTAALGLEAMAAGMAGQLRVERLDMTRPSEIGALRERLVDDRLDVLIANAGVSDHNVPVAEIDQATFNEVIAPGLVRTDLGGSDAPVTVEQVVPGIIDTIDSHRSAGGLHFVNAQNEDVPR